MYLYFSNGKNNSSVNPHLTSVHAENKMILVFKLKFNRNSTSNKFLHRRSNLLIYTDNLSP